MKKKDIFNYISIILILLIFLTIYLVSSNTIERFEDNVISPVLETRVSDIEKKYGELIPRATKEIGDRLTKYDNMYTWYEAALATQTTAAQQASAEAQTKLKDAKPNDPSTAGKITDSLAKGAENTGDKDNIKSVNQSIKKEGPPEIKTSSATDKMLSLYG